ncbi:MAG: hypothetical protein IJE94_02610 [Oscillospiraceae bacterium]|nr:hypothetical protein [Oscillospiraceae bacterium]
MKKKKLSPLWLIPAVVIVAMVLWCIHFPLTRIAGFSKSVEPLHATVFFDQVPETPAITYATDDPEQLRELAEQLRSVRGRFMGWFTSITYNEDPLLHLIVVGTEGNKEYSLSLSADSDGYIYIQRKHTQLRAKDGALYDYLTELVAEGEREAARAKEEEMIGEKAAAYLEKLIRARNFFEDADLTEGTVLTADGYDAEKTVMQYVVYKTEWLKEYHREKREDSSQQANVQINYLVKEIKVTDDHAVLTIEEDGPGNMWGIYTVELIKVEDTWLVSSVEHGDIYSREGMVIHQYREKMPELYEQARAEIFSFGDTLSVQVTNVIKTETRVLPAEDNFEYEVYTVLPGAEIRVVKTDMAETSNQGLVGDWAIYDSSGDYTIINPDYLTKSIPITETTRGIGTESVCVLVFELYTGEG